MKTVLITGAGGNIGSNMIRALRRCDEQFRIVGTEANTYYRHLSLADETYEVPYATTEREAYLNALQDIIHEEDVDVLLPTNVQEITVLETYHADLPTAAPLPDAACIDVFTDKWESYQQWAAAGVPVPETQKVDNPADVTEYVASVDGPVWVREFIGSSPAAGRTFTDSDAIIRWIDANDGWGRFSVGEYLPGTDCSWLGVYEEGELITSQGRERLAYSESEQWGVGAPSVSKTVSRSDINDIGRSAVEAISKAPHGVFFTDMRANDAENLKVTEVNPGRLGTSTSRFFPLAGLNVPKILVDIARSRPVDDYPAVNALDPGLHYIRKLDCDPVVVPETEIDE